MKFFQKITIASLITVLSISSVHAQTIIKTNSILDRISIQVYCVIVPILTNQSKNCKDIQVINKPATSTVVVNKNTTPQQLIPNNKVTGGNNSVSSGLENTNRNQVLPTSITRTVVEYRNNIGAQGPVGPQGPKGESGISGSGSFAVISSPVLGGSGLTITNSSLNDITFSGTNTFSTLPTFSLTNGALLIGSASSTSSIFLPGTLRQVLAVNASGTPTWTDISTLNASTTNLLTFATSTNVVTSVVNGVATTTTISELSNIKLNATTSASVISASSIFSSLVQVVTGIFTNLFASVANFGSVFTGNITATGTASLATTSATALSANTITTGSLTSGALIATSTLIVSGTTNLATTTISNLSVTTLSVPNTIGSSVNTMTSNVGGSVATSAIINTSLATSSVNGLTTIINGITSSIATIINSLSTTLSGNVLTTSVNGVTSTSSVISNNTISSAANVITASVNGLTSTSTAVNSSTLSTSGVVLSSTINGILATTSLSNLVASSTTNLLTSTGNVISSTINGILATSTVVNSNTVSTTTNTFSTLVNGLQSAVTNIINSLSTSLSGNVLTTNVNGVVATSSVIGSSLVSYSTSTGLFSSNINGVTATTTLSGLLSANNGLTTNGINNVSLGGALLATTTINQAGYALTTTGGKVAFGSNTPTSQYQFGTNFTSFDSNFNVNGSNATVAAFNGGVEIYKGTGGATSADLWLANDATYGTGYAGLRYLGGTARTVTLNAYDAGDYESQIKLNGQSGASSISFNTGGAGAQNHRAIIDVQGNFGIGNNIAPTEKLDIDGGVRVRALNASTDSAIVTADTSGVLHSRDIAGFWLLGGNTSGSQTFGSTDTDLNFLSNGANTLKLAQGGSLALSNNSAFPSLNSATNVLSIGDSNTINSSDKIFTIGNNGNFGNNNIGVFSLGDNTNVGDSNTSIGLFGTNLDIRDNNSNSLFVGDRFDHIANNSNSLFVGAHQSGNDTNANTVLFGDTSSITNTTNGFAVGANNTYDKINNSQIFGRDNNSSFNSEQDKFIVGSNGHKWFQVDHNNGEIQFDGSAGNSGEVLLSHGTGGTPTWNAPSSLGNISFNTGTTGSNVNWSSASASLGGTLTLNIPDASATARGLVTTGTQTFAGVKTFSSAPTFTTFTQGSVPFIGASGLLTQNNSNFFWDNTNSRLGLGISVPTHSLSVLTGQSIDRFGGASAHLVLRGAQGTQSSPTATLSGNGLGKVSGNGYNGSGFITTASLDFTAAENFTAGANGTYLSLSTTPLGTTSALERMRILANGNIGIGTINPVYKLDVSGFINNDVGYKQSGNTILYASSTNQSTLVGISAGANLNSTLNYSTALGYQALMTATSSTSNVAVGTYALKVNTTGFNSVALGTGALSANITGANNTALGHNALGLNIGGYYNTSVGTFSLLSATSSFNNTATGFQSLYSLTSGGSNVGVGYGSLFSNTIGASSVGIGTDALRNNSVSAFNTALGHRAGYGNSGGYTNTGSTYIGYQAGYQSATSSDYNTLLGYNSGYAITTGSRNVLLGQSTIAASFNQLTTGSNNIAIGNDVAVASSTASNQLNIANFLYGTNLSGTGATLSTGSLGIGTKTPSNAFHIASSTGAFSGLRLGITSASATTTATGKVLTVDGNGDVVLADSIATRVPFSGLTAATGANTIDNTSFAQTWDWSTATSATALALTANSLTSGKGLSLTSSATSLTGDLQNITLSGSGATNTGNLLNLTSTGANSLASGLNITTSSSKGLAAKFSGRVAITSTSFSTVGTTQNASFGNFGVVRLTGATAQTIGGIEDAQNIAATNNHTDGEQLTLINAGTAAATISNQNASSDAENRIITGTGADLAVGIDASINLVYDGATNRWRVVGGSGSSTGGFSSTDITDKATGGNIGTAAATVDTYTNFNVNQTTASQTLSLPNPTNTVTTKGKVVTINNVGSATFTIGTIQVSPSSPAASFVWSGTAWNDVGNASNVASEYGSNTTITNAQTTAATSFTDVTNGTFTIPSAGTWKLTYSVAASNNTAGQAVNFAITDSANSVLTGSGAGTTNLTASGYTQMGQSVYVTTAGAATYKLRWGVSAGTATLLNTGAIGNAGNSTLSWEKTSGNSAVTGQSVDYADVSRFAADHSTALSGTNITSTNNNTWQTVLGTANRLSLSSATVAGNLAVSATGITISKSGTYKLSYNVDIISAGGNGQWGQIIKNGTTVLTSAVAYNQTGGVANQIVLTWSGTLNAGDVIDTRLNANSAGTINISGYSLGIHQLGSSAFTAGTGLNFDSLRAAVNSNALDNTAFAQTWDWSTLSTGTGLAMSANALTTGILQKLTTSSSALVGAAGITGAGSLLDLNATGAATAFVGNLANIQNTGLTAVGNTGTALNINLVGATQIMKALAITDATTGNLGTATGSGGVNFNFTGAHTGNGLQLDSASLTGQGLAITTNSLTTGTSTAITANALTTGAALSISGTSAYTGQGLLSVINNTSTAGTLLNLSGTSLLSSASGAGIRLSTNSAPGIVSNSSGEDLTTPAGNVLSIDSGTTGNINIGTSANAKTITLGNATGATALTLNSGTGLQSYTSLAATTNAFNFTANSLTSGNGLALSSAAAGLTGNLLSVTSASTGAVTAGLARFNFTGAHTNNGVQIDDATTGGNALVINANALAGGKALFVNSSSAGAPAAGFANFTFSGAHTGSGFQIDDSTTAGNAMTINANSITTGGGQGLAINANGLTSATGGALFVSSTGAYTGANGIVSFVATNAGRTGTVLRVTGSGSNSDVVSFIDSTNTCTGNPGATMLFTCSSDQNLKHNISSADNILEDLNSLNIRKFDWNTDGTHEQYGVIAQEVEQTNLSYLVSNAANGYKAVRTVDSWMLVKGLQELNTKVESGFAPISLATSTTVEIEVDQKITDILSETPRIARDYFKSQMLAGKKAVKDFASERITALSGYFENLFAKKIHTEQICMKKSDNTDICINGDQLQNMVNGIPATTPGSGVTGSTAGGSGGAGGTGGNTGGDTSGAGTTGDSGTPPTGTGSDTGASISGGDTGNTGAGDPPPTP